MHIQTRSMKQLGTCGAPIFFHLHCHVILIHFTQFSPLLCTNWEITPGCSQLQVPKLLMLHFDYTNAVPPITNCAHVHLRAQHRKLFGHLRSNDIWPNYGTYCNTGPSTYTETDWNIYAHGTNAHTVEPPKMRKPWAAAQFTLMDKVTPVVQISNKKWHFMLLNVINTKQEKQMKN